MNTTNDITAEEARIPRYTAEENPFRTPEGYFENFTGRMMERIRQESAQDKGMAAGGRARTVELRPRRRWLRYSAAAAIAGICIAASTYIYNTRAIDGLLATTELHDDYFTDETLDDALDYEMDCGIVDNSQIAYYLTEAY